MLLQALCIISLPSVNSTRVTVQKRQIRVKISHFVSPVTLKFDGSPWKITGHFFNATSSFLYYFIAIGQFKLELQSGNAKFRSKSAIFVPCDLEIWQMTLKNNWAPLLCYFKVCTSFNSHGSLQAGVRVRKRQIWVKIGDFCPVWPWNLTDDLEKQ